MSERRKRSGKMLTKLLAKYFVTIKQTEISDIQTTCTFHERLNRSDMPEICGLISGNVIRGGIATEYRIISVVFPRQRVASTTACQISGSEIANFARQFRNGEQFLGWFHTHPKIGAFFSDIDWEQQKRLQQTLKNNNADYDVLGMVFDPINVDIKAYLGNSPTPIRVDIT
jgi:proteasome lid subunit RPN8/RPN11